MPWVNSTLLKSINRKNRLFYKYKCIPTNKNRMKYTNYKNTLTNLLRNAKKEYYCKQFTSCNRDIKGTWRTIKNVLNSSPNSRNISKIKNHGTATENKQTIAEIFNDFFTNIGPDLARSIPTSAKSFDCFLNNPNPTTLFMVPTNEQELTEIVKNLKIKKTPGYDDITNKLLKSVIKEIIVPVTHIMNMSMLNGIVPGKMKIAKVVPIFKKGDPLERSNYRPISLLTTLSKILEKLIYTRTFNFFTRCGILADSQFGFRKKHSTSHAILLFINKIASALDDRCHTVGLFLDFSKAFDTIDHNILFKKLQHYGVRGKALEWYKSYLSSRTQFVSLNGIASSVKPVTCGVPQGSLLGPLLFITYINDFKFSSTLLSFILYADDSSIFYSHQNPQILVETVNSELENIAQWIFANRLSLNLDKTNFILFSNSISDLPGDICFNNVKIKKVKSTKFLGLFIDDKMSWKIHTNYLCSLLSRNAGVIYKLKPMFPTYVLQMLYSTLMLPYLNYGILAWGSSLKLQLDKILVVQKRAIQTICNVPIRTHSSPLFFNTKVLRVRDIFNLQLGCSHVSAE